MHAPPIHPAPSIRVSSSKSAVLWANYHPEELFRIVYVRAICCGFIFGWPHVPPSGGKQSKGSRSCRLRFKYQSRDARSNCQRLFQALRAAGFSPAKASTGILPENRSHSREVSADYRRSGSNLMMQRNIAYFQEKPWPNPPRLVLSPCPRSTHKPGSHRKRRPDRMFARPRCLRSSARIV